MTCKDYRSADLQILIHHVYEYKKGIRNMVLHTMNSDDLLLAELKLKREKIPYFIQKVSPKKINVFFGRKECVDIVKSFKVKTLTSLSCEQDFILGIMLGYDRMQQCKRYTSRNKHFLAPQM